MRLAGALVLLAVVTACGVPSDATLLPSSRWVVTELDGEQVPEGEIWLHFEDDSVQLLTQPLVGPRLTRQHCRIGTAEVDLDLDGGAASVSDLVDFVEGPCDPGMSDWHDRIAGALRETRRWEISGDTLDLTGSGQIRLQSYVASE